MTDPLSIRMLRYLEGRASAGEVAELNAILLEDREARAQFLGLSAQAQLLHELTAPEDSDGPATGFEEGISVDYVFEELVANRTLKNFFIEAADTHLDIWRNHRDVCRRFEEIQVLLTDIN